MNSPSREVILCIGSNCGDRMNNVRCALNWLSEILKDFRHSHIYATPDCHGGERVYFNAVVDGKTNYPQIELDRKCKDFELFHGRDASAREAGDVPVDIDLISYDGTILRERDYASEFFLIGFREIGFRAIKHTHCST